MLGSILVLGYKNLSLLLGGDFDEIEDDPTIPFVSAEQKFYEIWNCPGNLSKSEHLSSQETIFWKLDRSESWYGLLAVFITSRKK